MSSIVKVDINSNNPVWLSPTVEGEILKMLQNFSITISKTEVSNKNIVNGPGDVPCIILRDFSKIVSKNDFESAELSYLNDEKWSYSWIDDDLTFSYSDGAPFGNGIIEYNFVWRNFYTLLSPENKKVNISVEAYSISDCDDGFQEVISVQFAYPAYISSFKPNEKKSTGIVETDLQNNNYIVSRFGQIELNWTGAADFTDTVILRKDGAKIAGSFFINDSYNIESVKQNAKYELTVTNSYNFSDIRVCNIIKTNWENMGLENGIFLDSVYSDLNYNSRIFVYRGDYYAYKHPLLYKRDKNRVWKDIAENSLYNESDYSCYAAYLYDGLLYIAGSIKGSDYFAFCHYDMQSEEWETDTGRVNLSSCNKNMPICCGFSISKNAAYFYRVNDGFISAHLKEDSLGWGGGQFYFNAPSGMKIITGTMIFHINQFYVSMICKESIENGNKYAYLYDCMDQSERYLMKLPVSQNTSTCVLLETDNSLWLATENKLINCDKKAFRDSFYPLIPEGSRAWLCSYEDKILGIFPDKNLWIYKE